MIVVHRLRWFERELHTRIPFRYGIATMVRLPHVWLELEATIEGERVIGQAADHLPPKWFTKDPSRSLEDEVVEMRRVLAQAGEAAVGRSAPTVHALMQGVDAAQIAWAGAEGLPSLLAHFGVTLVERALIDGFCQRHGSDIGTVLRNNGLGIELGDLHPELAGMAPAEGLPTTSLEQVAARHTVGLADPLEENDIAEDERPDDGLPVSLRAVCRYYGQREFKIKVAGEGALERLIRVVTVITEETGGDYVATLDGNEFFATVEDWRAFWEEAQARPELTGLWPRLMFVEQPLHRDHALGDAVGEAFAAWSDRPAHLIDESGATPADLRRALELGYQGVSHKNCKGVIQGPANRCLLALRDAPGLIMSAEDLSNVGPIALPQDLAVQAALGNASVERNGHHYFTGLAGWPANVSEQVIARYPDLYAPLPSGPAAVQIAGGQLDCRPANAGAFGSPPLDLSTAGDCWCEQG
jgi:hypothetical protein